MNSNANTNRRFLVAHATVYWGLCHNTRNMVKVQAITDKPPVVQEKVMKRTCTKSCSRASANRRTSDLGLLLSCSALPLDWKQPFQEQKRLSSSGRTPLDPSQIKSKISAIFLNRLHITKFRVDLHI